MTLFTSTELSMPFFYAFKLLVVLSCAQLALSADVNAWRGRSIYQVITDRFARPDGDVDYACNTADKQYCGGTWTGLINKLDYIQGMGFTAVWISPVVKGLDSTIAGQNYHGFWQTDIMDINENFGTPEELKNLSDELHKRDMYLMVDILANNLAYNGPGNSVDYNSFPAPFNNKNWFHPFCYISNYSQPKDYQQCWLGNDQVPLVDIKTELPDVRTFFKNWAKDFVSNYSVDGFRIDAVKHVEKPFWQEFQADLDTYMIGEVYTQEATEACDYTVNALDAVLNFPLMYAITQIYSNAEAPVGVVTNATKNVGEACRDTTALGTFVENHDVPRFGSATSDLSQRKNAIAYAMTGDGIPIVYYGSEQGFDGNGDPANREALWTSKYDTSAPIYKMIKSINAARNAMIEVSKDAYFTGYWKQKSKIVFNDDNVLAVRKGYDASLVSITTNKGSKAADFGPYTIADTNFDKGQEIVEVLSCTKQVTGQYGVFKTTVRKGEPQVWVPTTYFNGTLKSICPSLSASKDGPASSAVSLPSRPLTAFTLSCIAMVLALL